MEDPGYLPYQPMLLGWAKRYLNQSIPREVVEGLLEPAMCYLDYETSKPWSCFIVDRDDRQRQRSADLAYDLILKETRLPGLALTVRQAILALPPLVLAYSPQDPDQPDAKKGFDTVQRILQQLAPAAEARGIAVSQWDWELANHPQFKAILGVDQN